jgi:hypothetical protein
MKKLTSVLLCILLSLSLFACVAAEEEPDNINDYAAGANTHKLSEGEGGGTLTFEDGHAESAVIVGYTGKSIPHKVIIPSVITDAKRDVSGIGDEAFYQLSTIKEIVLPDTVTFIGKFAFAGCTALESIVIPESVEYIDENAFYGCTSLKSVTFKGKSVRSIGDFAFLGCTALETIVLPEGLLEIGNYTFGNCSALKNVKTPSTLESIGTLTFHGCEALNAEGGLTLSASIKKIGEFAFNGIGKENIVAPEGSYAAEYVNKMTDSETGAEIETDIGE